MIISEEARATDRSVEEIWALWSEPATWSAWDPDITSVDFDGEFVAGAGGSLKPTSGPSMKWELESVEPLKSFVTTSKLPGATVSFVHLLNMTDTGLEVTHRIEMRGWSTPLFSRILGSKLAPSLSEAVENLASGTSALASCD